MANYFVFKNGEFSSLYEVTSNGSKVNTASTRHVCRQMDKAQDGEYVSNMKKTPKVLVYGKLRGFVTKVSDDEIWDVIDKNLSESARQKDFKDLRAYFDEPNSSEVECWHESGATVVTKGIWIPFETLEQAVASLLR